MSNTKLIKIAVSGAFDPLHIGHIRYIREACKLGNELVVLLNSDEQLIQKKGFVFMPFAERKEILEAIKDVDEVIKDLSPNITCEEALKLVKPTIFAKGGDRTPGTMAQIEIDTCKEIGCEIVYGVGGGKIQSSQWLTKRR